jgi:hypothetical protein
LLFLSFNLKTNKVKNQIYTKLTVNEPKLAVKLAVKTRKSHPKSFKNLLPPYQNKSLSFLGVSYVEWVITHNISISKY